MPVYIAAIYASGQRQKFITIILIDNLGQLFHMCSHNRLAVYQ